MCDPSTKESRPLPGAEEAEKDESLQYSLAYVLQEIEEAAQASLREGKKQPWWAAFLPFRIDSSLAPGAAAALASVGLEDIEQPLELAASEGQPLLSEEKAAQSTSSKDGGYHLDSAKVEMLAQVRASLALAQKSVSVVGDKALAKIARAKSQAEVLRAVRQARVVLSVDSGSDFMNSIKAIYRRMLRLRFAFAFLVSLAISLSVFAGWVMMFFFSVFVDIDGLTGEARTPDTGAAVFFWLLPFLLIAFASIGDVLADLVFDAFNDPPMVKCQSNILAAVHRDPCQPPPAWMCFGADYTSIVLLEFTPLVLGIVAANGGVQPGKFASFSMGYMQGVIWVGMLIAVLYIFASLGLAVRLSFLGEPPHAAKATAALLQTALNAHKVYPGQLFKKKGALLLYLSKEGFRLRWTNVAAKSNIQQLAMALIGVLLWTLAASLVFVGVMPVWSAAVIIVLTVVLVAIPLSKALPEVVGPMFAAVIAFFLILGVGLIGAGSSYDFPAFHTTALMQAAQTGAEEVLPTTWTGAGSVPYSVCDMSWGSKEAPLTILDMAELASQAYEANCTEMAGRLRTAFKGRGARLERCGQYNVIPRWASMYFPPPTPDGRATRVVSVKGTTSMDDVYTDTSLFATIKVMQLFSRVEPILSVLPTSMVKWIVGSMHLGSLAKEQKIWEGLQNEVLAMARKYPRDRIVLTGHSLGGGLAQIVAARLGVQAVVWSAPGSRYSADRFGISTQATQRNIVVVVPEMDLVPQIDIQDGVVQHIDCRKKNGEMGGVLECHSMPKTTCEIWRVCGDPWKRNFTETCLPYVAPDQLGRRY